MSYIILTLSIFLSCIEGTYPKPDNPFPEDVNDDFDNDGYTEKQGDCNDRDSRIYPGNARYEAAGLCVLDYDGDGFGDSTAEAPYDKGNDCDDGTADINPFAIEVCDEVDNNCNDVIDFDSEDTPTWYQDADGDAFGVEAFTENACSRPDGYVEFIGDCDDEDPEVNPESVEICDDKDNDCNGLTDDEDANLYAGSATMYYQDADGDGFGWIGTSFRSCSQPNGMVENSMDCDDSNRFSNPDGVETCDGVDNDCDFKVDDEDDDIDLSIMPIYYPDNDLDGIGANVDGIQTCSQPNGYVVITGDCDDNNAVMSPSAIEICDGVDNNCDDDIDDSDAIDATKWYMDSDGDTYGVQAYFVEACDKPDGYVEFYGDCNDNESAVNPGAIEICDSLDNDCDLMVDDQDTYWLRGTENTFYGDGDGDGFGWPGFFVQACSQPPGMVANYDDCDDNSRFIHPNRTELCDGIDNDCDELIDDEDIDNLDAKDGIVMYPDADGDGYGDENLASEVCLLQAGFIEIGGDCDDSNNDINEGQDEYCDGIDNDCNGQLDEYTAIDAFRWYIDADGDSYGAAASLVLSCFDMEGMVLDTNDCNDGNTAINPLATEICDGLDNDCNGLFDEEDSYLVPDIDDFYYVDNDGDGYGEEDSLTVSCSPIDGYVQIGNDCDDDNSEIFPTKDADFDGWDACNGDCDDTDMSMNPYGKDLVGDGIDQDCDGDDANYQIDLGRNLDCGLSEGTLRCWGDGRENTPKLQDALWTEVGLSPFKGGCSMMAENDIQCFGIYAPLSVQSINSFVQFEQGANHLCLLTDNGSIACVGDDTNGKATPPSMMVHQISVGMEHNCAIDRTRSIQCWGKNDNSQTVSPAGRWIQVSVGGDFTCALHEDRHISCWGLNDKGQTDAPNGDFKKISSGFEHACALSMEGDVECWGQISAVPELAPQIEDIQSGKDHSCVLYRDGELECWGVNTNNILDVDVDADESTVLLDCNDDRDDLYPQDLDADGYSPCDGDCDDSTSSIGYIDADGDGFACLLDCDDTKASKNGNDVDGDGFSTCENDCNDNNPTVNPTDADGDGYTLCDGDCRDDDASIAPRDDKDGDGFEYCNDCDDNDPNIHPGSAYLESSTACMIDADDDGWGDDLTDLCCLQVGMVDSYGNGWDGASLQVLMNDEIIANLTLKSGESETHDLCFPNDGEFELVYNSGSWDSENTYAIISPDGKVVFEDGPFPSTEVQSLSFAYTMFSNAECVTRATYDSGSDCNDDNPASTGEDKDNDGSRLCDGDCDDFDPNVTGEDADGDGVSACNGDCDDSNPYDLLDRDGDGYTGCEGDCNDFTKNVRPFAIELVQDGIDQDCDGLDLDIMVSAGTNHTCAIGLEKTIACWGDPFAVTDTPEQQDIVYISAGGNTTVGITEEDELVCWGIHCADLPADKFSVISQGTTHGCGIDLNRGIQCWGEFAAIGNIPDGEFVRVAAGNKSTCAIKRDRNLTCWGSNEHGERSGKPNGSFLDVQGNDSQFCALTSDGKLKCWGDTGDKIRPTGVFTSISVGYQSGCVLNDAGDVSCWGMIESPPNYDFMSISSGYNHACGVDVDDIIHCWGGFNYGKNEVDRSLCTTLIDGDGDGYLACEEDCDDNDPSVLPVDIDGDGYNPCTGDCDETVFHSNLADVDGDGSTVGCDNDCNDFSSSLNTRDRDNDGFSTCDGDCDDSNASKNLEDADGNTWTTCDGDVLDTNFLAYPYATDLIRDGIDQDSDGFDGRTMIDSGDGFSCALDMNGSLECFGSNDDYGQISDQPEGQFKQVVTGDYHACALDLQDITHCWGQNDSGQSTPPTDELYMLSAGSKHSCALKATGALICWGDIETPPSSSTYLYVTSGNNHACAINTNGFADCWGNNDLGQNNIAEEQVVDMVLGDNYSCVLYRNGTISCYGSINNIPYDGTFSKIYGGNTYACALQEHHILCWDALGEVGGNIFASGLQVSYYDVSWSTMQDFSLYPSYQSGIFTSTIVEENDYDGVFDSGKSDSVAILFEGFLYIDTAKSYTFQLNSDDGSRLYINDQLIIDNDGTHGAVTINGSVSLSEGFHKIRLEYFEAYYSASLVFQWLDGNSYVPVPADIFYHGIIGSLVADISIGADYSCYVFADNTYQCQGSINNVSDEEWCTEFVDQDNDGNPVCNGDCDDSDPLLNIYDYDGDGLSTCDGDCNDGDANIGEADNDNDLSSDCSQDCDPTSPWLSIYANELVGDGIDQNCDGIDQSYAVSSDKDVTCIIQSDQTLMCWGNPENGKLDVPEGRFLDIEVSNYSICALDENQEIQCWGLTQYDQTTPPEGAFRQISGLDHGFCALNENGEIECWGINNYGQNESPNGTYLQVARGVNHACAISNQGNITCWGSNEYDQRSAPFGTFTKIDAGAYYSCAIDINGAVSCWGFNNYQQLESPEGVFVDIQTGPYTACALSENHLITCWGSNYSGEANAPSVFVSDFDMGSNGGCAITTENTLSCWGSNSYSMLDVDIDDDGYDKLVDCDDNNPYLNLDDLDTDGFSTCDGDRYDTSDAIHLYDYDEDGVTSSDGDCHDGDESVIPIDEDGDGFSSNCDNDCDDSNFHIHPYAKEIIGDGIDQDCDGKDATQSLSLGHNFTCGINTFGEIQCWGEEAYGVPDPPEGVFVQISSGANHACALNIDHEIECWGFNNNGQLNAPSGVYSFISSYYNSSCAIDSDGNAVCWGDNSSGQNDVPEGTYTSIQQGNGHSCVLDTDNYVTCWGNNNYNPSGSPNKRYQKIQLGDSLSCGLDFFGYIDCWGNPYEGATSPPEGEFVDLFVGRGGGCAITKDGEIDCWGDNFYAMLNVPEGDWESLELGNNHSCGILSDGRIECWGDNYKDKAKVDSDEDGINKLYDCEDYNLFLTPNDVDGDGYSSCDGDRNDQDASINLDDSDGDGISSSDGDCDDEDPNVIPIDEDGDGFSVNCDGDCDDSNRWIYPNAPEMIGDDIDQDCNGTDALATYETWTDFGCVIRFDGTLDCWGYFYYDKLAYPEGTYQQLSLGDVTGCVLDDNGEISCWGSNYYGTLDSPTGSYVSLSFGDYTGCALNEQGEAACWGSDIYKLISNMPDKNWIQISYGDTLGCGLDSDLYIHCWGENNKFQLGAPQGRYQKVYTGPNTSCAIDSEGKVTCWGQNQSNMFDLPELAFQHVDIGYDFICGISVDSKLYCAGSTYYGLSNPDYDKDGNDKLEDCDDYHPFLQRDDIDEDGYSTCDGDRKDTDATQNLDDIDNDTITSSDGDCEDNDASSIPIDGDGDGFSSNCDNDCDDNNILIYENAVELVGDGIDQDCDGTDPTKMLSSFDSTNCLIDETGELLCWGNDYYNYILNSPEGTFTYVDMGTYHACAIATDGSIVCWGNNAEGRSTPPAGSFAQLDVSSHGACAISTNGEISCWGYNYDYRNDAPEGVFVQIAQGVNFSCAIDIESQITCWGSNTDLQLSSPIGRFVQIELGDYFGCGLDIDGEITCWGNNSFGQLEAPEGTFVSIDASYRAACALDAEGNATCWGYNSYENITVPDIQFESISLGVSHACGFSKNNTLHCWGYNDNRIKVDFDGDGADLLNDCYDNDASLGVGDTEDCPGKNCKDILDIHQTRPDDLYYINPTGSETYLVDCDMDNGGFTKIFSHNTSGGLFFTDATEATSSQINDPESNLYSILDQMDVIASSDHFEFRMLWPGSTISTNHWTQTSNPLLSSSVEDYTAIDVDCLTNGWRGLALSSSPNSLIDGTEGLNEWYGIGAISGGIPNGCGAGSYVDKVELWLK